MTHLSAGFDRTDMKFHREAHRCIGMETRRICIKYDLLDSSRLLDTDKDFLKAVLAGRYDEGIAVCLYKLFRLLSEECGQKIILLIDEYDVPLDKAYQKGYGHTVCLRKGKRKDVKN